MRQIKEQLKQGSPIKHVNVGIIVLIIFMSLPEFCNGHEGHDHIPENPSFKYSKEANVMVEEGHHIHDHNSHHNHGHRHDHGHSHDHGHHHDHGHLHDHGHNHGNKHHNSEHHNHENDHEHNYHAPKTNKQQGISGTHKDVNEVDRLNLWIKSIGSTLLISAAPFLILYLIPLENTEEMQPRLKILLAFASGGLLGDAFLHLIPHAIAPHDHHSLHDHDHNHSDSKDHSHDHDMRVGLWVLGGIIVFLAVEKFVRLIKGEPGGHGHSHDPKPIAAKEEKDKLLPKKKNADGKLKSTKPATKVQHEDQILISGYLNLAADFTHNFTDGLAIGASYLAGNGIGIVTTITILLHEVPHEIGDFAILIKSGCSKKKAMMLQLSTAVGALAGTVLALLGGGSNAAASWVLPFTAGGFIYIATVSVLPELLEGSTKLGQSLKEIAALLAGVLLMVLIAKLE